MKKVKTSKLMLLDDIETLKSICIEHTSEEDFYKEVREITNDKPALVLGPVLRHYLSGHIIYNNLTFEEVKNILDEYNIGYNCETITDKGLIKFNTSGSNALVYSENAIIIVSDVVKERVLEDAAENHVMMVYFPKEQKIIGISNYKFVHVVDKQKVERVMKIVKTKNEA